MSINDLPCAIHLGWGDASTPAVTLFRGSALCAECTKQQLEQINEEARLDAEEEEERNARIEEIRQRVEAMRPRSLKL